MSLRYAPQGSVSCPLQWTSELAHKRYKDVFPQKGCGQLPARLSHSAGRSRKGVRLPIPSPVPTIFVYVAVKNRIWCRPRILEVEGKKFLTFNFLLQSFLYKK
jgi:hypothetical protein